MPGARIRSPFLFCAVLLALTACTGRSSAPDSITIIGALSYRERIALPPEAMVTVTLSDVSRADAPAPVLAEESFAVAERQVPISFALSVARAGLDPRRRYALRGTVRDPEGRLLWTTDSVHPVDPGLPVNDLGVLMMVRVPASAAAAPARPPSLEARGNEPPWQLTVTADGMELRRGYEAERVALPAPKVVPLPNGRVFTAASDSHSLRVVAIETLCRDSMTDLPYPKTVTLQIDGERLAGCGGRPAELLQGAEWVVEDIDNRGIIDFSRVTLNFGEEGRLAGRAGCNSYSAPYEVTGENLVVAQALATLRACAPALENQERLFLEILVAVRGFDISETGALVLKSPEGRTITARRQ